jgi:type VI secretion system secreted protein VgrG
MTISAPSSTIPARRFRALGGTAVVAGISAVVLAASGGSAHAAVAVVGLGTATSFAVLGGSGVTNTGTTTVTGDVGTYPTTTFVGSASVTIAGTNHAGDGVTQGAKTDLTTAYNTAAGEGPTSPIVGDLGGQTLTAGVYNSASSIGVTGALTLNAAGNADAVFVFQAGSTLTTASGSVVNLINGAQSCNVFWQVGSSATLGTGSTFSGTILALTDITVTTGVHVDGRVLARNGAVTLDTAVITRSACAAATTATPTATVTATTIPTTVAATSTASASATSAPQVTTTPVGAVHAGDGSMSSTPTGTPYGLAAIGAVAGLGLVLRNRRRSSRR